MQSIWITDEFDTRLVWPIDISEIFFLSFSRKQFPSRDNGFFDSVQLEMGARLKATFRHTHTHRMNVHFSICSGKWEKERIECLKKAAVQIRRDADRRVREEEEEQLRTKQDSELAGCWWNTRHARLIIQYSLSMPETNVTSIFFALSASGIVWIPRTKYQ